LKLDFISLYDIKLLFVTYW